MKGLLRIVNWQLNRKITFKLHYYLANRKHNYFVYKLPVTKRYTRKTHSISLQLLSRKHQTVFN